MVNKQRGFFAIKLGGKQRTMHFSMNFWAAFTDELGISIGQIDKVFSAEMNFNTLRALVYAGILAYDQEEGNLIDYNVYKVGAWCDELTTEDFTNITNALAQSRILGNDLNGGLRGADPKGALKPKKA
jgi:hypothetical protein